MDEKASLSTLRKKKQTSDTDVNKTCEYKYPLNIERRMGAFYPYIY